MSKLTKAARDALTDLAVGKVFDAKTEAAVREVERTAMALYNHIYKPFLVYMDELPECAFNTSSKIYVRIGGVWTDIGLPTPVRTFYDCDNHATHQLSQDTPEVRAWVDATKLFARLQDDRKRLRQKTTAALASINTVKQLEEQWPKMYKLYTSVYPVSSSSFPVLVTEQLDRELELT